MHSSIFKAALLFCALANVFPAHADIQRSEKLNFTLDTVASGLDVPWGLAALPDGGLLVTEKNGGLRIIDADGELHPQPIGGLPDIQRGGQGGLLDVAVHPEYKTNGWVYLSYASPKQGKEPGRGSNTALMRAKISDHQLVEQEVLFKALPNYRKGQHFGSRIAFDADNNVYLSIGDRGGRDEVQRLDNHRGKIMRFTDDGKIPADNPYVNTPGAEPATFTWGHRNPQGMETHPVTGAIWAHEHGPKGGDELNQIIAGENYGWPEVTYGKNYIGTKITDETEREGMQPPVTYWVPSIAPCGMAFVTSDRYPEWGNNLLIGSLKFQQLHRLEMTDGKVTREEVLLDGIGRVRAVEQGADGYLYLAIGSSGKVVRLVPE